VDVLLKKGRKEDAKRIVDYLKLLSSQKTKDVNFKNRIFDIVLNLNTLKLSKEKDGNDSNKHFFRLRVTHG